MYLKVVFKEVQKQFEAKHVVFFMPAFFLFHFVLLSLTTTKAVFVLNCACRIFFTIFIAYFTLGQVPVSRSHTPAQRPFACTFKTVWISAQSEQKQFNESFDLLGQQS